MGLDCYFLIAHIIQCCIPVLEGPKSPVPMTDTGAFVRPLTTMTTHWHPAIVSLEGRWGDRGSPLTLDTMVAIDQGI